MSRRPLAWIAAVLPLLTGPSFAGGPAPEPLEASEPAVKLSPSAPFEADAPGALLAGEREWIVTVDGARYALGGGRLSDKRAEDPAKRILTNARVADLLRRRAAERVAALRRGPMDEAARREASMLLWMRPTELSAADKKFLSGAAAPTRLAAPQPDVNFDGGRSRGGVAAAPLGSLGFGRAGPAGTSTAPDPALVKAFLAQVDIEADKDPRAVPAIRAALTDILKTPTGREIARAFVAEKARAKIHFEKIAGSSVVLDNGKKILQASGGNTTTWEDPPIVNLNRDYLDTDPEFMRMNVASTLAHEMLGHAFQSQRERRAGLPFAVSNAYRGDEANAGLIGWLVQTELGGRLDNSHMWNYLKNPEIYHRSLQTNMAYYAVSLSPAEMKDPVGTLKGRVSAAGKARAQLQDEAESMRFWRRVVEHFVTVHGVSREKFSSIDQDIDSFLGHYLKLADDNLDEIESSLKDKIALLESPKGAARLKEFKEASDSPILAANEARLAKYRTRLAGLTAGRRKEPTMPPVPGKLTWDDLSKMWADDDPAHKQALKNP